MIFTHTYGDETIFHEAYVTDEKYWSVTTSRHINKWLRDGHKDLPRFKEVPQERLDNLV